MTFDTVIHGGTVVTAEGQFQGDVGIAEGRIAAVAERIEGGARRIDAGGRLVLPGGIEAHAHIAQESSAGVMSADDYLSGSISAAFGGNSSFIPFAAQHRGQSVDEVIATYDARGARSVIDYSYHLIISDPTPEVLQDQLPRAFARGITSFKVFMTYDLMNLGDAGMLDILTVARTHGAITMVHAENNDMVKWMNRQLAARGLTAPKYHAISRPELAEEEAIHRAIQLAKLVDAPLFIVHVSTARGAEIVRQEKFNGARLFAETCPQYLALTRDDLDRPGMEGAKFICSPPLRGADTQAALWHHIAQGTFESVSSDHAPYRFDETGKFLNGADAPYPKIANGMPGIAARLPWLFSEGVVKGRITAEQFVALSSTNAARTFGCTTKGRIAPGMDADIAIWNPETRRVVTQADMHDNMDYTPFEGMELQGVPEIVMTRGEVIVEHGSLKAREGQGRFFGRAPVDPRGRQGYLAPEFDPAQNFGTVLR
ncbi:dihydropyrimidinase [Salipiger marinus]|jgi:dihydropyrimidinase|uniref:dihydropyrimidinase n=1 Tax=Salipiger marinus TaxID=555512 RepID=UPI000E916771|nr:dihydropyrimidinase [Salipiger manganoxidans]MCD1618552.1 dihydropyrimidinase [Salipiger manganoxidans]MEB3417721.1 dihydropyrimidinase [Salipiger manganoxidans]HBS98424.1 dihydropyrimidinase [Citreicella sp.]